MKGRTKLERKGRGFRDRLLSLGIMAAVLVIAALVLIFKRDMDSVVLKDGAYNYFGDVKVEYTGKCRVQYTAKEVTIRDENGTQTLNSEPLYQPDGMALLPFDYAWYAGNDSVYRLSPFQYDGDREQLGRSQRRKSEGGKCRRISLRRRGHLYIP